MTFIALGLGTAPLKLQVADKAPSQLLVQAFSKDTAGTVEAFPR